MEFGIHIAPLAHGPVPEAIRQADPERGFDRIHRCLVRRAMRKEPRGGPGDAA